ncbi:MAG: hypothetical protein JRD89_10440 [Deltaproteobacteria bacterium]|nr:hypothetical protein [Deltaproteobacteria bacterium]
MRHAIDKALDDCDWCRDHEFKGSVIFSSTKGDTSVTTEQRVDAASSMVAATVSKANARVSCSIAWTDKGGGVKQHLDLVGQAVSRCLALAGKAAGKDLVAVYADNKDEIKPPELSAAIKKAVKSRGYTLVEDVVVVASSCDWPGVLLADVLAYFGMWTYAGRRLAGSQLSLFEGGDEPSPAVLRKMATVQEMLESGAALQFTPKLS